MTAAVFLGDGVIEVEVLPELGARLHRLRAFGHDILRTPPDTATHATDPFFWGGYHMAPWCNRIDATTTVACGRTFTPAANFSDGSAIHGRLYLSPGERIGDAAFKFVDHGDDGWPWPYTFEASFATRDATLTVRQALRNDADGPMPAGVGFHPWFRRPLAVAIDAARVYDSNVDSPADPIPVRGIFDRRRLAPLAQGVDATWTDLGEQPVRIAWLDLGVGAAIHFTAPRRCLTAAAPADVDADAIEPQTHAPAGLRRLGRGEPDAMIVLGAGEQLQLAIDFEFRRLTEGGAT